MSIQRGSFEQALLARFSGCDESPGGEVWVHRVDALEAVTIAEQLGLRLRGLEGFIVSACHVFPAMSRVADFSPSAPETALATARALLAGEWKERPSDVHPDAVGDYMIDVVVQE